MSDFFSILGAEAWAVIALELLAFTLAVRHLFRAHRAQLRELAALERIRSIFGETADQEDEIRQARERIRSEFLESPGEAAPGPTATAELVRSYVNAARIGDVPEPGAAFSAAEAMLRTRLALPRTVAGLLVLIGLGGTLLGLTQAVIGINAVPPESSQVRVEGAPNASVRSLQTAQHVQSPALEEQIRRVDALLKGIEHTLAGMRTAFVPALIAVALTVLLLSLLNRAQTREALVLAQLDIVSGSVLRPLFRAVDPRLAFHLPGKAREASTALMKAAESASHTLTGAVAEIDRALKDEVATAGKAVEAAVKEGLAGMQKATEQLTHRVAAAAEMLGQPVGAATKRLNDATEKHKVALAATAGRVSAVAGEAVTASKRLVASLKTLDSITSQLSAALEGGKDTASALQGTEARIVEALEVVGKQVDRSRQSADSLGTISAPLVDASKDLQRMRDLLASLLTEQQKLRGDSLSLLRAHSSAVEDLARSVDAWSREAAALRAEAAASAPSPASPSLMAGEDQRFADYLLERLADARMRDDDRWKRRVSGAVRRLNAQNTSLQAALTNVSEALDRNSEILQRLAVPRDAGQADKLYGMLRARGSFFPWRG